MNLCTLAQSAGKSVNLLKTLYFAWTIVSGLSGLNMCNKPDPQWEDRKNGTELFQAINSRVRKGLMGSQ